MHVITWNILGKQLLALEHEQDPLRAMAALDLSLMMLRQLTEEVVAEARQAGYSWAAIGQAVGMTKQGAWLRFAGIGPVSEIDL